MQRCCFTVICDITLDHVNTNQIFLHLEIFTRRNRFHEMQHRNKKIQQKVLAQLEPCFDKKKLRQR